MVIAASDDSPVRVDKSDLFKLATAGLALSASVQIVCLAVAHKQFAPPGTTFAGIASTHFVTSAIVIWVCAQSSAIVPAVLAARHVAFRAVLVAVHVPAAWLIFVVSDYMAHPYLPPRAMAMHATDVFLMFTGGAAGLTAGLLSQAAMFGWVLARDTNSAVRPTFTVRGILFATAAAAVLLTTPRFVPLFMKRLMIWIYSVLGYEPTTMVTVVQDTGDVALLVMGGLAGILLTINLSAAIWGVRSRQGYKLLIALSLTFGLLGVLTDSLLGGGSAGPGMGVALAVSLFAGSLLATAQTAIWERFGWRLIRIHRDSG